MSTKNKYSIFPTFFNKSSQKAKLKHNCNITIIFLLPFADIVLDSDKNKQIDERKDTCFVEKSRRENHK